MGSGEGIEHVGDVKTENRSSRRRRLGGPDRRQLAAILRDRRAADVAETLGIHVQTLLAIALGQEANHSTIALVEYRMKDVAWGIIEATAHDR